MAVAFKVLLMAMARRAALMEGISSVRWAGEVPSGVERCGDVGRGRGGEECWSRGGVGGEGGRMWVGIEGVLGYLWRV